MLQSSNKFSATAATLTEFLPIVDDLIALREKYGEHEFGKQYNALPGAMKTAFTEMGVTEYTVNVGDPVDTTRMIVVGSEYSDEYERDTVLRPINMGMELQGNVILKAECVASLGPEASAVEEEGDYEDSNNDFVEDEFEDAESRDE